MKYKYTLTILAAMAALSATGVTNKAAATATRVVVAAGEPTTPRELTIMYHDVAATDSQSTLAGAQTRATLAAGDVVADLVVPGTQDYAVIKFLGYQFDETADSVTVQVYDSSKYRNVYVHFVDDNNKEVGSSVKLRAGQNGPVVPADYQFVVSENGAVQYRFNNGTLYATVEPVEEDQPETPVEPVDEDQPGTPVKPVDEDQPGTPVKPADEDQPETPAKPVDEDQPETPVKPVDEDQPETPVKPVDEDQPETPVKPVDEDQLETPVKPVDEDQPETPVKPVDEDQPETPVKPVDEDQPETPVKPVDEDRPGTPVKPVDEDRPETPVKPVDEDEPETPIKPVDEEQPDTPVELVDEDRPVVTTTSADEPVDATVAPTELALPDSAEAEIATVGQQVAVPTRATVRGTVSINVAAIVYDEHFAMTARVLPARSSWHSFGLAVAPDGEVYYDLGGGQFVAVQAARMTLSALAVGQSDVEFKLSGTATVDYVPQYGIQLWADDGQTAVKNADGSKRKLRHGSAWRVFGLVTRNGRVYYDLGGGQLVDSAYIRLR